jgi:hypothetical protein
LKFLHKASKSFKFLRLRGSKNFNCLPKISVVFPDSGVIKDLRAGEGEKNLCARFAKAGLAATPFHRAGAGDPRGYQTAATTGAGRDAASSDQQKNASMDSEEWKGISSRRFLRRPFTGSRPEDLLTLVAPRLMTFTGPRPV